jgi:hypothetical protein
MALKSGRPRVHPLICYVLRVFNVALRKLFCMQDYESSYSDRLKKLNLIPISYWLEIKDIVFYYKCKAGLYDLDIDKYIEIPCDGSTRSSTGEFLRPNLCRTTLFRNSYFNRIVYLWNSLPSDIKSSSSVYILKAKL